MAYLFLFALNLYSGYLPPSEAEKFYWQGFSSYHKGDYKSAEEFFTKAIKIDPSMHLAYVLKGLSQIRLGNRNGFKWIEKGKAMKPQDPRPYIAEGIGYCCLSLHQRAILSFNKADRLIKTKEKWKVLQYDVSVCQSLAYYHLHENEKAIAYALKAVNLPDIDNASKGYILGVLGFLYIEAENPREAIKYLKEGEKISPDDPYIPALLGYAYLSPDVVGEFSLINYLRALYRLRKAHILAERACRSNSGKISYWRELDTWVLYWLEKVKVSIGVYIGVYICLIVMIVGSAYIVAVIINKRGQKIPEG